MQYRTTSSINHDGKIYPPGELIDLEWEAAKALLQAQAIERVFRDFEADSLVIHLNVKAPS